MKRPALAWLLMLFSGLLFLTGCAVAPSRNKVPPADAPHTIYLLRYGWHTALLFDSETLRQRIARLRSDLRPSRYVLVGWGDGAYFVQDNAAWSTAVKALVASDYPALQVGGREVNPPLGVTAQDSLPLAITARGMEQLLAYLERSIATDAAGQPIYLGAQTAYADRFYQANGHYSLLNNCNSWIVGALRAAELPIAGLNLTASSVFEQARQISALQAQMRENKLPAP